MKWWIFRGFGNVRMCAGVLQNVGMSAALVKWWGNGEERTYK
jgi:hypothetical protein